MIIWSIFKILNWAYGWVDVTYEIRCTMTFLSGIEMVVMSALIIGFCVQYIVNRRSK